MVQARSRQTCTWVFIYKDARRITDHHTLTGVSPFERMNGMLGKQALQSPFGVFCKDISHYLEHCLQADGKLNWN
jgi:hypothetical protein